MIGVQDLLGVLRALALLMLEQEPCRTKLLEAKALPAVVEALGELPSALPPRRLLCGVTVRTLIYE